MSYTKIMPRGGTKYEWSTMNPILAERELVIEYPDSGVGTGLCRFKLGDGFKTYKELAYAFDGASASNLIGGSAFAGNVFQIRADTHDNWLLANPILEENELVYDSTYDCFYIGDGASRFNQLTPCGRDSKRVYDFGDEDEDDIQSPVAVPTATAARISPMSAAPTATLGDLMSMALGTSIDPQPIEGGTPLIIGSISTPTEKVTSISMEDEIDFDKDEDNGIIKDDGYSILDEKEEPVEEEGENTESELIE